jgi:translation initiation factor 1
VAKARDRLPTKQPPAPLTQSLSGLAALRAQLPPGAAVHSPQVTGSTASASEADPIARANKVVLRRERKGHGGKTATRIEGLSGSHDEVQATLRELKGALGCGATIDGDDILVQGDQVDRVVALLQSRGVKKIVVGN